MTFLRRLKFYGIGFALGLLVLYAVFGTRSCVTPNEIKVQELRRQTFDVSDLAKCKLRCMRKNVELLKLELRHFEVNYSLSSVRKEPCGEYFMEPKEEHSGEYDYKLVILDCDTITRINDIQVSPTHSCQCR